MKIICEFGLVVVSLQRFIMTINMRSRFFLIIALLCVVAQGAWAEGKKLPYTYGFENDNLAAEGWTEVKDFYTSLSYISGTISSAARIGDYAYWFEAASSPYYLISPEIDSEGRDFFVSFYYMHIDDSNSYQVGYSTTTNEISAFSWESFAPVGNGARCVMEFPANAKYVAIKAVVAQQGFILDDFCFA